MAKYKTDPILIVQGAQYGSEAKGMVALALCKAMGIDIAVRTGSINAGHTVVMPSGTRVAFQQIPVAAVLPDVKLVLGPGAYIHEETLEREISITDCKSRLYVDNRCGIHLDQYTKEAATEARHLKIGATGKGCAEAIIHKIKDRAVGDSLLFKERILDRLGVNDPLYGLNTCDTAKMLTESYHDGAYIMLEGTQGSLLDFHTGPYPYVTSRQTISSAWVAEAGLSPTLRYEVALVARTFPIRVAGNSGPMSREIDWPTLARRINARLKARGYEPAVNPDAIDEFEKCQDVVRMNMTTMGKDQKFISLMSGTTALGTMSKEAAEAILNLFETTTVTKRIRRIAELNPDELRLTVQKENATFVALTFLNYVFPELVHERKLHKEAKEYVRELQGYIGCPIKYVSIGPRTEDLLDCDV